MLEGMANHQARAVRAVAGGLLLYAPAVLADDYLSALAYLVRRLDENTAPQNFLRDMFGLTPGTPAWERQREAFSVRLDESGRRPKQLSRRAETGDPSGQRSERFENEPDSDWTQQEIRAALLCFV